MSSECCRTWCWFIRPRVANYLLAGVYYYCWSAPTIRPPTASAQTPEMDAGSSFTKVAVASSYADITFEQTQLTTFVVMAELPLHELRPTLVFPSCSFLWPTARWAVFAPLTLGSLRCGVKGEVAATGRYPGTTPLRYAGIAGNFAPPVTSSPCPLVSSSNCKILAQLSCSHSPAQCERRLIVEVELMVNFGPQGVHPPAGYPSLARLLSHSPS